MVIVEASLATGALAPAFGERLHLDGEELGRAGRQRGRRLVVTLQRCQAKERGLEIQPGIS